MIENMISINMLGIFINVSTQMTRKQQNTGCLSLVSL